jgi:hypothetical protein
MTTLFSPENTQYKNFFPGHLGNNLRDKGNNFYSGRLCFSGLGNALVLSIKRLNRFYLDDFTMLISYLFDGLLLVWRGL